MYCSEQYACVYDIDHMRRNKQHDYSLVHLYISKSIYVVVLEKCLLVEEIAYIKNTSEEVNSKYVVIIACAAITIGFTHNAPYVDTSIYQKHLFRVSCSRPCMAFSQKIFCNICVCAFELNTVILNSYDSTLYYINQLRVDQVNIC